MTPGEHSAATAIAEHEGELETFLQAHKSKAEELQAAYTCAREAADVGARRLLTRQKDDLVTAVIAALRDLGFLVQDVDATLEEKGTKWEDLRIDAPEGGWEALAEVRGYATGAKSNDLLRLERFVNVFVTRNQRRPAAVWHMVNQFLGKDPDTRLRPMGGQQEELNTFAEEGGLVIETRDLFRLWRAVAGGNLAAEDARSLLMGATGLFIYPLP